MYNTLFLAGIGKKIPENTAFSVKTCRYRQENAISGLNIEGSRKRLTSLVFTRLLATLFFCTYV